MTKRSSAIRSEAVTSRIMRSIRGKDSKAEMLFRRSLFATGVRYRKHYKAVPGTPDVAIVWAKIAIFIDGDFWHGNSWRTRGLPSIESQFPNRQEYWSAKIRRNIARDKQVDAELKAKTWSVLRFWESQVLSNVEMCVRHTLSVVSSAKPLSN